MKLSDIYRNVSVNQECNYVVVTFQQQYPEYEYRPSHVLLVMRLCSCLCVCACVCVCVRCVCVCVCAVCGVCVCGVCVCVCGVRCVCAVCVCGVCVHAMFRHVSIDCCYTHRWEILCASNKYSHISLNLY